MEFRSPPSRYRPAPFWSWNDALDDEELRWQVRQLQQAGYGGFFMHPRVGLETEYLSDAWFDRIGACVDEARKLGVEAWLYDEDKWPSGFAGGWLTRKHPETRGVGLAGDVVQPEKLAGAFADAGTIAVFAIVKDDKNVVRSSRRLAEGDVPRPEETIFRYRTMPFDNDNWFNGEAYMDVLDPDAVRKFLDMTMEGYNRRFRNDYGKAVPGIFTDEPNFTPYIGPLGGGGDVHAIPWTRQLPERFRERYGYDLIGRLDALACRPPGFEKVRHDYYRLLTELFVEAFSRPYGEMCERLGLKLTGHWLFEDTLQAQLMHAGAAMPHYEFEQVPGIDHLRRNIEDPLTLKQVASVAHQFGRDQVLCEIFGVSGQDFTFEDAKWIGDFHFALGVNYFCPHLTLYSFAGDRKRDYPPTFSYHQPYWDRMSVINDYFARAGYLTRMGEHRTRVLVLHPIASAWSFFSRFEACPEVERYHQELVALQKTLLGRHRDFDYGDEIILSRHGRVEARELRVASHGRYDVVIVPPSFTWADETVALLEAFAAAGGRIIFAGQTPVAVGGKPAAERWGKLLGHVGVIRANNEPTAVLAALDAACPRDVSITDGEGKEIEAILYHHRTMGDKHVYFFSNTDRTRAYDARIILEASGTPMCCDLSTGEMAAMPAEMADGHMLLRHRFTPVGSLAVLVDPQAEPASPKPAPRELGREMLDGDWQFERTHPNTLVLDVCRWSLNDAPLGKLTPVWKVRHAAFDAAGLEQYRGLQPWVLTERGIKPTRSVRVQMRFEFQSDLDRPDAFLVVERAEHFAIQLNGHAVPTATDVWHWDKRFGKMRAGPFIRKGVNELVLTTAYRPGVEIEDVFLVGDFATRQLSETRYAITAEPAALEAGDWCLQGYHFYAGNMVYRRQVKHTGKPGQRVLLRLAEPMGTLFEVRVNGQLADVLAWRPWEADLTGLLRDGDNELEIIVYGSLRNAFGPLHNTRYAEFGNNWWIGPGSFTDEAHWTDRCTLAPYGLIDGVEVITVE